MRPPASHQLPLPSKDVIRRLWCDYAINFFIFYLFTNYKIAHFWKNHGSQNSRRWFRPSKAIDKWSTRQVVQELHDRKLNGRNLWAVRFRINFKIPQIWKLEKAKSLTFLKTNIRESCRNPWPKMLIAVTKLQNANDHMTAHSRAILPSSLDKLFCF